MNDEQRYETAPVYGIYFWLVVALVPASLIADAMLYLGAPALYRSEVGAVVVAKYVLVCLAMLAVWLAGRIKNAVRSR